MAKVSVIGTGTWGIALANLLCRSSHEVMAWSAIEEEIEFIQKHRKHPKLKDTHIDEGIKLTKNLKEAIEGYDVIVMAVPSVFVRSTSRRVAEFIEPHQIVVDVAKGIESSSLFTMSEIIHDEISKVKDFDYGQIVALSGPTHAEEVSIGLPTTIVSACTNEKNAKIVQDIFSAPFMRVYTNNDVRGVEICGALKNVVALAAGISHGLGYGDNATAALITRGISEVSRLGIAMGCATHTFYGLAGLGDMIVTCTSLHSRNNQCGTFIGQGFSVEESIEKVGMVVEGINALDAAYELSIKYNVELPIIRSVYDIVKFGLDPKTSVRMLFDRDSKAEIPFSILELIHGSHNENNNIKKMKKVITYGSFDLLSYDHIDFIKRAKSLGDYLIVALSTDDFAAFEKHKQCCLSYSNRKSLLEAMRFVDLVIPEETWDQKIEDCRKYRIDTFVMREEWKGKFDYLEEEGVEVVYLPCSSEMSARK